MRKIILFTCVCIAAFSETPVYAQFNNNNPIHLLIKGVSIGYQKGLDATVRNNAITYASTNRIILKKYISKNWSVESGLKFGNVASALNNNSEIGGAKISIPTTLQYNFKTSHSKLHSYCGAGIIYNLKERRSSQTSETVINTVQTSKTNLLFTQGNIFEINTHLQFNEAVHFIPQSNNTIVGVEIGIGFNL